MTQSIDQGRLRAAAEHLEWVFDQYRDHPDVQGLAEILGGLIADAKAGRIEHPVSRRDVPGGWHVAEGTFRDLRDPSVEGAYGKFAAELRGGRSDREKALLAKMALMRQEGGA